MDVSASFCVDDEELCLELLGRRDLTRLPAPDPRLEPPNPAQPPEADPVIEPDTLRNGRYAQRISI